MKNLYIKFSDLCSKFLTPIANLGARIYLGLVFWKSGVAKVQDMEETVWNFDAAEDGDFALSIFNVDLPAAPTAYLATYGELILPILLWLGLLTRIGAGGLLIMSAVIYFAIGHEFRAEMAIAALLLAMGGSKISVDNFLFKR